MNNYIKININSTKESEQELLIALMSEEGYDGFEETDHELHAFIPEKKFDEEKLNLLLQPFSKTYIKEIIAPKNWNAEWEANYEPVVVDDFVAIRAHFHQPIATVQHEIVITPKMSFGTGHHATTWQMMKLMQGIDFSNQSVFDFGCGTVVLAILAEKLGAKSVLAMDYDELCIDNSFENIETNGCSKIKIEKGDAPPIRQTFNVILANINRHILLNNMQLMAGALVEKGYLLISGFYVEDNQLLIDAANIQGMQLIKVSERHNWSAMVFQKLS